MRGHVALHEDGAAGRVDTQRQVLRGGDQGPASQRLGLLSDGDGVQVDHAEERVVIVLQPDPVRTANVLESQVQSLQRVSPAVEPSDDGALYLDIKGLNSIYPALQDLESEAVDRDLLAVS